MITFLFLQVFVFITISKFGALNCALIGLARKMLSLLLSFILYGHTLNAFQTVGLALSLTAMIANFYEKGGSKKGHDSKDAKEAKPQEKQHLLAPEQDVELQEFQEEIPINPHAKHDKENMTYMHGMENPSEVDLLGLDIDEEPERPAPYSDKR